MALSRKLQYFDNYFFLVSLLGIARELASGSGP